MTKDAKIAVGIGVGALAICVPLVLLPFFGSRPTPAPTAQPAPLAETEPTVPTPAAPLVATEPPVPKPYTLSVKEVRSLPGLRGTPLRGYSLRLQYASPPTREDGIKACVAELEAMAPKLFAMHQIGGTNLEASAYVYVGDKQMLDPDQTGSETGRRTLNVNLSVEKRTIYMIPRLYESQVLKQL